MTTKYGLGILIICFAHNVSVSGETIGYISFHSYNDNTFEDIYNVSLIDCVANCIRQAPRCVGVNYSRLRSHCQLCRISLDGSNGLIEDRLYVYSVRGTWNQSILNGYGMSRCDADWQFYNDFCYRFDLDSANYWDSAKTSCETDSARLVEIHDREKQDFLKEMIFTLIADSTKTDFNVWTGGTDLAEEMTFRWNSDNAKFTDGFTNWEQSPYPQPDNWHFNQGLSEDCVAVHYVYPDQAGWKDIRCDVRVHAMCEKVAQ